MLYLAFAGLLAAAAVATGCGPSGRAPATPRPPTLEQLRDQAREQARVPGDAASLREAGWLELLTGDTDAGTARLEQALEKDPHHPDTLLGLALMRQDAGHFAEARDAWLLLLREAAATPGDPRAAAAAALAADRLDAGADEAPGVIGLTRRLGELPQALPPAARRGVLALRARLARKRGDERAALGLEAAMGCVPRWGVIGPYGNLPRLELARAFPPETPAGLAQPQHSAGEDLELRIASGRGCRLAAESQTGRAGVLYGVAGFSLPRATPAVLVIESDVGFVAAVDGRVVLRRDDPARFEPLRREVRLELPPGAHRLVVKLGASGRADATVVLATPAGAPLPGLRFVEPAAASAGEPPRVVTAAPPPAPAAPGAAGRLIGRFLAAYEAYGAGDSDRAEELCAALLAEAPSFASGLFLRARIALRDPARPRAVSRTLARAALGRVLTLTPRHPGALFELALLDMNDERPRDALARLVEARKGAPARARIDLTLTDLYDARGWDRESELSLADAEKKNPESCRALESRGGVLQKRRDVPGLLKLAARLRACDAESEYPAQGYREADDLPTAVAEYRRLLALAPQRESARSDLAEVLLQSGDAPGAAAELAGLVRLYPRRPAYRLRLADALLAGGAEAAARRALEEGIARMPEAAELHKALEALGVPGPLEPFRLDGREVIAAFERGRRAYGSPAVYVLDRTVTRVFPGGARLTLTHNIIKILTKEGAEKFGEVQVPEGADVLLARTVKRDGTTREPEEIAGKQGVSAPDLEAGDYVEFEYVVPEEAPAAFPGGFAAERFFFRSYDAPLDRTEYVVVTPAGLPLIVDARADAPAVEQRDERGLTVRLWRRRGVPQAIPEPASPPVVELQPSVRVGARVSAAQYRDAVRDQLVESWRANGEVHALAARLCGGKPARECAGAVHAFVGANIQNGDDEGAAAALARRQGNRLALAAALLRAAGLAPAGWLVRGRTQAVDPRPGAPAPLELADFGDLVLRVETPAGPLFLDPRLRRSPFGYLAPNLRGATALPLTDRGPLYATVPVRGTGADRRAITLAITLGADGAARVRARERLAGVAGVEWRESLDQIPADQLKKEFEQRWLGYFFAGGTLGALKVEGREQPGRELVFDYDFGLARLGRKTEGGLVLPASFFPAELSKRYVGVARREAPLLVLEHPLTELHVEVKLPPGARVAPPPPIELRTRFGTFVQRISQQGDRLVIDKQYAVPLARIRPADYGDFVRFATTVDQAEAAGVEVALPAGR
ncbi:MAG TPA: tetratricopeptide repeat protein [Polyangia bacterium]